jgi:hypothetical protein
LLPTTHVPSSSVRRISVSGFSYRPSATDVNSTMRMKWQINGPTVLASAFGIDRSIEWCDFQYSPRAGPLSQSRPAMGRGKLRVWRSARRSWVAEFVPPLEKVWMRILGSGARGVVASAWSWTMDWMAWTAGMIALRCEE